MSKEMGIECIHLMLKKLSHKMTLEEYYSALIQLDRKYPLTKRKNPLPKEDVANYKEQVIVPCWGGHSYLADIEPLNFKESAEMYVRHSQFIKEHLVEIPDQKTISTGEQEQEVPF